MDNIKIKVIGIIGAFAISISAFGAHMLKHHLNTIQTETYRTASLYLFIHLIGMLIITLNEKTNRNQVLNLTFTFFLIGIVLFSGSLYILSIKHLIGGDHWNFVGPLTPLGGLAFIIGWLNMIRFKI